MSKFPLQSNNAYQEKIDLIIKYSSTKSFWQDIENNRPHNRDDYLNFLLPISKKIRYLPLSDKIKRDILQRLRALWDYNAIELGIKATPQDIFLNLVNYSMVKIYSNFDSSDDWIRAIDYVYDCYYTNQRINKYNKFKVIN